jgi:hypothetical protein
MSTPSTAQAKSGGASLEDTTKEAGEEEDETELITMDSMHQATENLSDDEYDPVRPNEYEDFCAMRAQREAHHRERERFEQQQHEHFERRQQQQQQQQHAPPAAAAVEKKSFIAAASTGEEAYMRRVRMSEALASSSSAAAAVAAGHYQHPAAKRQKLSHPSSSSGVSDLPTRIVVLCNMAVASSTHNNAQLPSEVAQECQAFGKVLQCFAFQAQQHDDVLVFVEFLTARAATECVKSMHNRLFAGRSIRAEFFRTDAYKKKQFIV